MANEHVGPSTTFTPLNNIVFRSIWATTQVGSIGWLVQTVAISWLMATISTSDLMVALVQASTTLPAFLLSIIAGAIADIFSRRSIMLVGLALIAFASFALGCVVAFDLASPWLVLLLGFIAGSGYALNDPAWHASVGDILHKREIPAAVTLISVGYNMARSIGPALGGAIVAFSGPLAAFIFAGLANLAPLMSVWRNSWTVRSLPLPPERMTTAIHDGLRFTALSLDIRVAIARAAVFGFAVIAIHALLPLIARDRLGGGAIIYGILFAGFGVGACAAGLSNRFLRQHVAQEWLMLMASAACAICCFLLATTTSTIIATVALSIGGIGWVITWTGFDVWVQLTSPRWVVGRTMSIYYALLSGGLAAGSWVWGTIAQTYGLSASLQWAAVALIVTAAIGFIVPVQLGADGDQEGIDYEAPGLVLDIQPRSGPIASKTTYSIDETDIDAFLLQMRQRRYAIARAGARDWTLQRDLQHPSKWTETFRTPTWMDYLRMNHRLSPADQEIARALAALHGGEAAPQTELAIERPAPARSRVQPIARM